MNDHDPDAAAALVAPSIVIVMGPQRAEGVDELRQIATQSGPETLDSRVEIIDLAGDGQRFEVIARRVQHWAETGDLASEERLAAVFHIDDQGLITRAELNPKPLDE